MRTLALTLVAALAATSAFAEETVTKTQTPVMGPVLSGAVTLDFAETAAGKAAGTMGVELDIDAGSLATVDLDFKATDGSSLTLDTWTVGTTLGAFGVAVGLSDYTTDVTEVSNLQGAYTIDAGIVDVTASVDYNRTSENYVWGADIAGLDLGMATAGGMVTYDNDAELFAYESTVGVSGFTAYVNGTDVDALQNVGGEWTIDLDAGLTFTAGANYDTDAQDLTPRAGLSFNF